MPQLNKFLDAMSEYRAEALILEEGQTPSFRFLSGTKSVSKHVLDSEAIFALIAEVSSPETVHCFQSEGSASFIYDNGPSSYSGILEEDSGTVVATLWETSKQLAEEAVVDEPSVDGAVAEEAGPADGETSFAEMTGDLEEAAARILDQEPSADAVSPNSDPDMDPAGEQMVHAAEEAVEAVGPAKPLAEDPPSNPGRRATDLKLISLSDHDNNDQIPDDLPSGYRERMEALLRRMIERGASDLHLCCGQYPVYRVDGHVSVDEDDHRMEADELFRKLFSITPQRNRDQFLADRDTDFAYAIEGVSRYRVNLFFDRHGPGAVFRAIPDEIIPASKLGLTQEVQDLADLNKGLVLVTGPTGSGKSTTLAGILDLVNERRQDHIITIEDPVEFVHPNKKCLINQREVGVHTKSFKAALRAALREDPDVILVGELRDLETMEIAIETAETGHLVFGTLHTTTAASTVDRIIDQFPADRQAQVRVMLSESLRAVISQTLLRKKSGGRVAAHEILLGLPAVRALIREGKTFQIGSQMQTGKKYGMQTLNDHLLRLVQDDLVEAREAYLKAVDKDGLVDAFGRNGINWQG
jgi:twitching motility protein PilT